MDSRLLLSLFLIFFTATTLSSSSEQISVVPLEEEEAPKVKLTLYYESLCPYCSNFIVNYLLEIFENGIDAIVDLKLIPYGNAKVLSNGTITCQHGPRECLLNTIEACAIHAWPDVHDHFPFILCVEMAVYKHKYVDWDTCYEKLHLDSKPVTDCYNSGYGNKDYPEFITFVCRAYKGRKLPKACLRCLALSENQISRHEEREFPINPVTYKEETSESPLAKIKSALTWWMQQAD